MNGKLFFADCLRALTRPRLRTALLAGSIALGVATLVAGRSIGAASEREIRRKVDMMFGPGTILIFTKGSSLGVGPAPERLRLDDLEALESEIDELAAWDPSVSAGLCEIRSEGITLQTAVRGHSDRGQRVWHRDVIAGRYLEARDQESLARVALLGTTIAAELFGAASPIDREILIDSTPFRVVGLLESIGIDPHGEDRDRDVIVPFTTAMRRLRNVDTLDGAKLLVRDPQRVERVADRVRELLNRRHGQVEGEADEFAVFHSKFASSHSLRATRVLSLYVPLVGGLMLLVAVVVISNIMLGIVHQRRAEIGVRCAVGATVAAIRRQFLVESLLLSAVAGLLGVLLGSAAALVAARWMGQPWILSAPSLAMGFGAALAAGVLSSLAPAQRAARMDPVEVLR